MNKLHSLLAIPILALSMMGCKRSACFTLEHEDYLCARYPIQFRNCSENAEEYEWDFGDGETSVEMEPQHTYAYPGQYEIKLTAINGHSRKTVSQTLDLEIPFIDSIKIVAMSPTKPNGDPWDPDLSGPDVKIFARDCNQPIGASIFATTRHTNITMPQNFPVSVPVSFCALDLVVVEYNDPVVSDLDTISGAYLDHTFFLERPYKQLNCYGGLVLEFFMSHH